MSGKMPPTLWSAIKAPAFPAKHTTMAHGWQSGHPLIFKAKKMLSQVERINSMVWRVTHYPASSLHGKKQINQTEVTVTVPEAAAQFWGNRASRLVVQKPPRNRHQIPGCCSHGT